MNRQQKQIIEKECKEFFSRNENCYETPKSLATRLGRLESQIEVTLESLTTYSFLATRSTGKHRIFFLNKNRPTQMSKLSSEERNSIEHLTAREKEVVQLVLAGLDNSTIAERLSISAHTVKNHMSNIYQKLQVKDRYQLLRTIYHQ